MVLRQLDIYILWMLLNYQIKLVIIKLPPRLYFAKIKYTMSMIWIFISSMHGIYKRTNVYLTISLFKQILFAFLVQAFHIFIVYYSATISQVMFTSEYQNKCVKSNRNIAFLSGHRVKIGMFYLISSRNLRLSNHLLMNITFSCLLGIMY